MKRKLILLAGGLVGTTVLTALHQTIRKTLPDIAPRMDLLDIELIHKAGNELNITLPSDKDLYKMTFIGEFVGNTAYYSLIGTTFPRLNAWFLGTLAGAGAVVLPEHFGINPAPSNRTKATQYLTIGYYVTGALAAAATVRWLKRITK